MSETEFGDELNSFEQEVQIKGKQKKQKKEKNINEEILKKLTDSNPSLMKIGFLGDTDQFKPIETFSTTSIKLDSFIRYGGIPRGRITHIFGPERSLKTTISALTMKTALEANDTNVVMICDLERTLDSKESVEFFRHLGFKDEWFEKKRIFYVRDYPEMCFNVAEQFVRLDEAAVLVVDSLGAIESINSYNKGFEEHAKIGMNTTLIQSFLKRINTVNNNTAIICLNQVRDNMDARTSKYQPYRYTGGRNLRHMVSLGLDISGYHEKTDEGKKDSQSSNAIVNLRVRIEKCKLGGENSKSEIKFILDEGRFDELQEIIDLAEDFNMIISAGPWQYLYDDVEGGSGEVLFKCMGKQQMKAELQSNETFRDKIKEAIKANIDRNKTKILDFAEPVKGDSEIDLSDDMEQEQFIQS